MHYHVLLLVKGSSTQQLQQLHIGKQWPATREATTSTTTYFMYGTVLHHTVIAPLQQVQ